MDPIESKIVDFNGEAAIVFPPEIIKQLNIKEGQNVDLNVEDGRLVIKMLHE